MRNFIWIILTLSGVVVACTTQQQTCVESDKLIKKGDTCLIVEGDTINKPTSFETSHLYELYINNYQCCLTQVTTLHLDAKKVPQKNLHRLAEFKNLRSLFLKGYTKLPDEIGQLIHLRHLNITNYGGEIYVPESVKNLHKLKEVSVYAKKFPSNLLKVPNLQELTTNGIYSQDFFPKDISALQSLTKIHLGVSDIFPQQITQLTNLTSLKFTPPIYLDNATHHPLAIPNEIKQLKKLQHLKIYGYTMDTLTQCIGELTSLKTLELPRLKKAPKTLGSLTKLHTLNVVRTQAYPILGLQEVLPPLHQLKKLTYYQEAMPDWSPLIEFIKHSKNLEELFLSGGFETIPPEVFPSTLRKLAIQCPAKQKLIEFPNEITRLTRLTQLTINLTRIRNIPPTISNLTQLELLDMRDNKLEYFTEGLNKLANLKYFYFQNNRNSLDKKILKKYLPDVIID
jgi:Leucine-rich repeat (LRR) protein